MDVLNAKERVDYAKSIKALINVIQHQENGLREHDEFLGDIAYHYPKAPEKPIIFASYKNMPIFSKASISIRRHENDKIWTKARISDNGSLPEYLPGFDNELFAMMGLVFLKTEVGKDVKNKYFIYQTNSSPKVLVKFYVEASHLADGPGYPKNFEFVDIELSK